MMPSSGHRRHKKPRTSAPTRDWTGLPQDILFTIFLKLGPREILRGADRVCTAWRRVAVGEPLLWRRLNMGTVALSRWLWWRAAVRRGARRCESFSARCCSDASLRFLVTGAPSLKSLRLVDANTSFEALSESIQKLAQLEELELELQYFGRLEYNKLIQCICEARPKLKRLSVRVLRSSVEYPIRDREKFAIPVMWELRSLELTHINFTLDEFLATIDNCPLLELLHISRLDRFIVKWLRERCKEKNLTITSGFDIEFVMPVKHVVEEAEPSEEEPELGRGKRARQPVDRLNL